MKKKTIEKIPYLKLAKVSRKKNAKYIGVTAVKTISHEKHLLLEVYQNSKKTKDTPLVRIVLTEKDFGTYIPESGEWTRQKIEVDGYYYNRKLIWHTRGESGATMQQEENKNILQSDEDLERIKKFCEIKIWNERRWWDYIYKHQDNIVLSARRKTEERKYQRRQQALNDRIAHTQELPKQKILERVDSIYFNNRHYLYYKKHGCWAQIACSKCGGVTDARWKSGISYESQFQCWTEEPREGHTGDCPLCGTRGEYKCQGKVKKGHRDTIHIFLGQKYKEVGMVLRYIEVSKAWNLGLICGEKGLEMRNASEELSGVETARAYFEPGKNPQIDYHKHSGYSGKDFWDDCNLYGTANISISAAPIMEETYREMEGTIFQYSALQEYVREVKKVNPIEYFERYQQTPQIEVMVKMGLIGVVEQLVKYHYGIVANENANRPDEFLGIRKERVKLLIENRGDIALLETMQMERRMQQVWTDEQLRHLTETQLKRGDVETATRYMSLQQLLNRIEKYAGCEYETECSTAMERIRQTATTYVDYLNMRLALGYDLNNTVYQQPRRLGEAHAQMVMETNKEETDKRLREVKERYPNIRNNYRALRKRYFYEDDNYIIRPARSAEEIVAEGRILHHCVGGDNYLQKHNDGTTYILMLRRKEDMEAPYITVEIGGDEPRIMQWYGSHNRKPDEKTMQKWLDDYITRLKSGTITTIQADEVAIA